MTIDYQRLAKTEAHGFKARNFVSGKSHFGKEDRKPKLQTQQRFHNGSADILVGIGLFALQKADKNVGAPDCRCLFLN
jgi:hypothetical protein